MVEFGHGGDPLWILHAYTLYKEKINELKEVFMPAPLTQQHPQQAALPLYHTIAETMATLRISRSTVNRWADSGKLEKIVLGPGSARITTASIYNLGSTAQ
jgi:hypothetical protein